MLANAFVSSFFVAMALFGFWVVRESMKITNPSADVVFGMVIGAIISAISAMMAVVVWVL